jgi:hypothetical protein
MLVNPPVTASKPVARTRMSVTFTSRRLDPAARHFFDRGGAEVNKTHIVLIEDLVKVLFEGWPLDTVGMNRLRGREYLGNGRIGDPRSRFVAPEFICGAVGFFIHEEVIERANPWRKAARLPQALEDRLPLIGGHFERRLREEI